LHSTGETFLTASSLLSAPEALQGDKAHMCLSCDRPLDSLSRTLAEVITHQTFRGTSAGAPMKTAQAGRRDMYAKKALREIEDLQPSLGESPRVSLTRSVQKPTDRYADGKRHTMSLNLPRELYDKDVEKMKRGRSPRKAPLSMGIMANSQGSQHPQNAAGSFSLPHSQRGYRGGPLPDGYKALDESERQLHNGNGNGLPQMSRSSSLGSSARPKSGLSGGHLNIDAGVDTTPDMRSIKNVLPTAPAPLPPVKGSISAPAS